MKSEDLTPYRARVNAPDLEYFTVSYQESDMLIATSHNLKSEALASLKLFRKDIDSYIEEDPFFRDSFVPLEVSKDAPEIVKAMAEAAKAADVGPMAAVAGALAEFVGRDLLRKTSEVIVENGGDIFIKSGRGRVVGIYAGDSRYTGKVGIRIKDSPCGICTSSGKVGRSFSFGEADAVVVLAKSASIADAFATAIANTIHSESDVENSIDMTSKNSLIKGLVVIVGGKMGIVKDIEIVKI